MNEGVFYNLSNAEYHAGAGVNKSLLDIVAQSPAHAKYAIDNRAENDNEPTTAQLLGSAFHTLALEPHIFNSQYAVQPSRADYPHAIDDREVLAGMIETINQTRLPKLPVGGTKAEQIERILENETNATRNALEPLKAADLKAVLEMLNQTRLGLLPTSGSRADMAEILRGEGVEVTLWSEVVSEFATANAGKTILDSDTYEQLSAMVRAVLAHPVAGRLITGEGKAEASVYWNDATTGELCRCRPDFWRWDGIIVDLKTTDDASPAAFGKSVANWRYHVQSEMYLEGMNAAFDAGNFPEGYAKPKAFIFLVVEKKPPYAVASYVLDAESAAQGQREYRDNLALFAECKKTDTWPAYGENIQTVGLPTWYLLRNGANDNNF